MDAISLLLPQTFHWDLTFRTHTHTPAAQTLYTYHESITQLLETTHIGTDKGEACSV